MSRKCWDDLDNHSLNDIRNEYYEEVRSLAKEIVEDANKRDGDLHDVMHDVMHEWVDGHEWIIHTYKAKFVCLASRNDDADLDQIGERETVESQAYFAMCQDIYDNISIHISDEDDD